MKHNNKQDNISMDTLTQVAQTMQTIFGDRANTLAREVGFTERERVLTGTSFVVGLVSGWAETPAATLNGLSQAVGNAGTPITPQGLHLRFTSTAVDFLRAMIEESIAAMVSSAPCAHGLLSRFNGVVLTDSTIITLPNALAATWRGSGGYGANASTAAMKLSLRWNVSTGQMEALDITTGVTHDRNTRAYQDPVTPGALQLRDLGYFNIDGFAAIEQQGGYWLSRYSRTTHLLSLDGQTLPLLDWLPKQEGVPLDKWVLLGRSKQHKVRLIALRVPAHVVAQRRERIIEEARQNQRKPSSYALALAQWTIYLTNVPASMLTPDEALIFGRYRWQIELLFKLWKSDLHLDEWRMQSPTRLLCTIFGKLLAAVVTHWLLLIGCWHNPRRSLRRAMPTIRGIAWQWANSLHHEHLLLHALQSLQRALSCCQMETSRHYPRAFQLLEYEFA
jgi:hypothetical protein